MRKVLVIVDFQYDFCNPNGALYVPGAEEAKESILKELDKDDYEMVILSMDWHPLDHCSFKENGGEWPTHCVRDTYGCGLDLDIYSKVFENSITKDIPYHLIQKGYHKGIEQYAVNISHIKALIHNDEITICGLAGDFCVLETLKINMNNFNCSIFLDGIASIDGGAKLNKFIADNNIKTI